jgi:hypothetical protein
MNAVFPSTRSILPTSVSDLKDLPHYPPFGFALHPV